MKKIIILISLFAALFASIEKNHNFASNGQITLSPYPVTMLVGDNSTLYVGIGDNSTNADFKIYCYNSNGTLNSDYGTSGVATADFNGTDILKMIAYDTNGTFYALGFSENGNTTSYIEAIFDDSGALQSQTSSNITINADEWINITTDYTDLYILASYSGMYVGVSVSTNGTTNSTIFSDSISNKSYQTIGVDSNGGYILGGSNSTSGLIAKYTSNGTLDTSFNSTGYRTFDSNSTIYDIKIDYDNSDGIYASGTSNNDLFVVHLYSNGTIDTNFGDNGYIYFDITGSNSIDSGGWITSDGNATYYLAGTTGSNTYLTQFTDLDYVDVNLNNGWTYFSLGSDFTTCNETLQSSNSTCQDTYDLAKLFGTPENSAIDYIVTYNSSNSTWSYYNKNSSNSTYSMNTTIGKISYLDLPMGIMIKTHSTSTISVPFFESYGDQSDRYFDNIHSGWNLMGSATNTLSTTQFLEKSKEKGVSLKYVLVFRNNEWLVYAPTNDSEVDSSLTRLENIYPNESYWVYIE